MIIEFNILLSSAGHRVERVNLLKQTLREMGLSGRVLAADMDQLGAVFQAADGAVIVPRCTSPDFIPAIRELCEKNRIHLIIPGIDPELPVYADHRQQFTEIGTTALISTPDVIAICNDKRNTHRWLSENGFPTPRQTTVEGVLAEPKSWPFPLFVKPATGSASVGARPVRNVEELKLFTQPGDYIVQTLCKGDEHTVDVLANRQGECLAAVPRRRLEVRSGEVFKGITVRDEAIESLAREICEKLPGAYGPLNIQMFVDEAAKSIQVTEINPRLSGGYPLTWQAGANFPRWVIEEILGRPSTVTDDWQDGLVMLRYFEALYLDSQYALW